MSIRLTIGRLMIGVAFAVTMASILRPSELWASVLYTLTLMTALASIVGVFAVRGPGRGAWFGSAIFCLTYLAIAFGPFPWLNNDGLRPPPLATLRLRDSLPWRWIPGGLYNSRTSVIGQSSVSYPGSAASLSMVPGPTGLVLQAREAPGEQILHCYGALVFSALGALVGRRMSRPDHPSPA